MSASFRLWGLSSVSTPALPNLKAIKSIYWPPCSQEESRLRRFGSLVQLVQPASQGPLPLDKPDQLPPTFLQGRNGESAASNVQGQAPSLPAPSVEPQPLAWPHHDTGATQEPLRVSRGNLGNPWSSESGLLSLRQSSQGKWKESDTSLLSSGYAGDEENSEVSLVANTPNLRLPRRLHTQAGSAPSSQLCTIYSPSQIRSRVASQACGSRQAGEEKRGQPAQQQ
ncbi:PREDICTED: protein TNT, partial [Odobenus rosmarus divergens]|uniref:Protein TNT n=1 Tax=Odobenus rosmarus divergens TaxID=9708 RepID=A0A9B0LL15_ODORO